MGILDGKKYLTGDSGVLSPGDTFRLHNARIAGNITIGGQQREEAKLLISTDDNPEPFVVFTSGAAIVSQVKQIDDADVQAMKNGGLHLKLGQKPTTKGNPMYLFVDPSGPTVIDTDNPVTTNESAEF